MSTDRDRKYRRQWFLTIGILLLLGMVLAYDLYLERRKTESIEHDRLLVQARVIDENLSHQLVATYQSMQQIVNDLPYWRVKDAYQPVANIMLKTIEEAMPEVRTLIIIDAKGIARASSRQELIGRDLSQREYFQIVRRHPDPATMYLSPPYTTVLNVYVMTITRMVPGPTGGFNGIIVAALDPEYFKTLLASVQYAPDMWVAIAHGDGQQFMTVPDRSGQAGKDLAQRGSFFSRHRDSGRYETIMSRRDYIGGEERIMAIRTIHPAAARLDEPLIVAVGRDLHAVFADWRRETMIYGGVFLVIVVITVFLLRHNQISVRRAEEERYANEIKFKAIFENSVDAIGVSRVGTHVFVNPAYATLFGYSSCDELVGKPILDLIAPAERATILHRVQRRAHGEAVPMVYESKGLRQDGSEFVMDVHASTYELFGEIFTLVIMRDITKRKRAEEELRESSELLRTFMNAIDESAFLMDREGRILAANETVAKRFGKTLSEFTGLTMEEILPPEVAQMREKHVAEVVRTKKPVRFEDERMGRTIDNSIYPVFNGQGEVGALAIVGHDITERKLAEEAIQQNEKKLRDITASLGEGLYVLNDKGEVTFMNPEAERLLGWTEGELRHKNIHDAIHSRKPNGSPLSFDDCKMHNVIQLGTRFFSHDQMFMRKDGTLFPASVISTPLRQNDHVTASITVFRDISDIKQVEQEREKLIADLQKALTEIKTLHGILPICSSCKKIRDDKGSWHQLEAYIHDHTDAKFSHGLCADCAKKLYPKYYKEEDSKDKGRSST